MVHQPGPADFQHAAHLSLGWRPDSSLSAVVCRGTRPQPDGGNHRRLYRRRRADWARLMDALGLVWHSLGFYSDELLARPAGSAAVIALGQAAASRGLCLSLVQYRATGGRVLGMFPMQEGVRHFPDASRLPILRGPVCRDQVSGLRQPESYEQLAGSRLGNAQALAAHQV